MEFLTGKLENLAKQGVFGDGSFLRVQSTSGSDKGPQFQSEIAFLRVDLVPATGKISGVPLVVKQQMKQEELRKENGGEVQFVNEVTMYKNILPELGALDLGLCSKMFHGEASNGENVDQDIVVLEDLRPQGYKVPDKLYLDADQIVLAINKLGKFHGLSYKMKMSSPERLVELENMLIPKVIVDSNGLNDACLVRGIKPLVDTSPSYSVVNKVYKKLVGANASEVAYSLQRPEEPFAVITHGDFNGNNLLFKYNDAGDVLDVKMIDFGFACYLDPAVDIAFFLYLNTSPETRTKHWDSFLHSYWEGVISVVEYPGFSYSEFLNHFSERAFCGYIPCCFFLPMMLVGGSSNDSRIHMTAEERRDYFSTLGGKESTDAVTAIVSHLLAEGYLDAYLRNFDKVEPLNASTPGYTNVTFNFS
ncbi:hypothetical protein GE061_016785 [Apolygus lucorum]|uniref:CHK kinase-like domain-containing protein n=1 Tax=Apolygus lucorum TaxID=248454 RepID=A0A8S9XJ79_APOLU|nr:hypothetical protein GE061_016785 [Apolygus lucorum]